MSTCLTFSKVHRVGEGKKSVAIEVTIQPADRTLTDEDFDGLTKRIIANVEKSTGGVLRG